MQRRRLIGHEHKVANDRIGANVHTAARAQVRVEHVCSRTHLESSVLDNSIDDERAGAGFDIVAAAQHAVENGGARRRVALVGHESGIERGEACVVGEKLTPMSERLVVHVGAQGARVHGDVVDAKRAKRVPQSGARLPQHARLVARHRVVGLERAAQVLVSLDAAARGEQDVEKERQLSTPSIVNTHHFRFIH